METIDLIGNVNLILMHRHDGDENWIFLKLSRSLSRFFILTVYDQSTNSGDCHAAMHTNWFFLFSTWRSTHIAHRTLNNNGNIVTCDAGRQPSNDYNSLYALNDNGLNALDFFPYGSYMQTISNLFINRLGVKFVTIKNVRFKGLRHKPNSV